ncbi:hypothetical protein FRC17_001986 [Serendipita sp. 399]|nr:hypothetical protein FRC17_001986 [Serendipita sp. 399]
MRTSTARVYLEKRGSTVEGSLEQLALEYDGGRAHGKAMADYQRDSSMSYTQIVNELTRQVYSEKGYLLAQSSLQRLTRRSPITREEHEYAMMCHEETAKLNAALAKANNDAWKDARNQKKTQKANEHDQRYRYHNALTWYHATHNQIRAHYLDSLDNPQDTEQNNQAIEALKKNADGFRKDALKYKTGTTAKGQSIGCTAYKLPM